MTNVNDSVSHRFRYHVVVSRPRRADGTRPAEGPVVVGVDGSRASHAAVVFAADLARSLGTDVVAVHAIRLIAELMMDIPPMGLTAWRRQLESTLSHEWCAPLKAAGVGYGVMLVERPVATALVGVAEREHACRIVVGSPHHGNLAHVRGTLPERLRRHAPCPVVVVPSPRPGKPADAAPDPHLATEPRPEPTAPI